VSNLDSAQAAEAAKNAPAANDDDDEDEDDARLKSKEPLELQPRLTTAVTTVRPDASFNFTSGGTTVTYMRVACRYRAGRGSSYLTYRGST